MTKKKFECTYDSWKWLNQTFIHAYNGHIIAYQDPKI